MSVDSTGAFEFRCWRGSSTRSSSSGRRDVPVHQSLEVTGEHFSVATQQNMYFHNV